MRKLRSRKKMLTVLTFAYAAILVVAVTYAAVSGLIDFTGTATTSADLSVEIAVNSVLNPDVGIEVSPPTLFQSSIAAVRAADGQSMTITVDLRAPGDSVWLTWQFANTGTLPVEFEAPVVDIQGIDEPLYNITYDTGGNRIYTPALDAYGQQIIVTHHPIVIEGFSVAADATAGIDAILDFEDLDGYSFWTQPTEFSSRFGMSFTWDEDIHIATQRLDSLGNVTHTYMPPLTFTIEFPYIIGDVDAILNPPTPTPYPTPVP
jgi:hypothetical protein